MDVCYEIGEIKRGCHKNLEEFLNTLFLSLRCFHGEVWSKKKKQGKDIIYFSIKTVKKEKGRFARMHQKVITKILCKETRGMIVRNSWKAVVWATLRGLQAFEIQGAA